MEKHIQVEKSIIKTFKKEIWKRFLTGINKYQLIQEGDRIAVCISGGKDSMLMAKCMQHLQKYGDIRFELEYLVMDPGYSKTNRQLIEKNAQELKIPITVFESQIFEVVASVDQSPCYLCAKMRRGHLYNKALELGCNKISLGHHFDDVIETILMSMLFSGEIKTMMPKLHSSNFKGIQLIRPMYMVKEADILAWKNENQLQFLQCACKFTEDSSDDDGNGASNGGSKRLEMKKLINELRQTNQYIDYNIFNSVQNINLDAVIGYRKNGDRHSFLDEYEL